MKTYQYIARQLGRAVHFAQQNDPRCKEITDALEAYCKQNLPSGSGIDHGTKLDLLHSTVDRLVFIVDFHHMDEHGGYDGWTVHTVVVKPDLRFGIDLRITGRDRNQIKEYLGDVYQNEMLAHIKHGDHDSVENIVK